MAFHESEVETSTGFGTHWEKSAREKWVSISWGVGVDVIISTPGDGGKSFYLDGWFIYIPCSHIVPPSGGSAMAEDSITVNDVGLGSVAG